MPTVLHRARLLRLQFLFPSSALSVSEPPWIPDQIVSLVRSRLFASENPLQVCVCVCVCVFMRALFCLRVLPKAYLDPYYPRHVGEQFGVLPFNGWVGWEVQTSQTSPFLSPWLLLAHLRPTWQPKISSTEGSWRKMPSRAATIAPRLTHSRALYSGNKTHKHTHTHTL